jgi:hypothetical protein
MTELNCFIPTGVFSVTRVSYSGIVPSSIGVDGRETLLLGLCERIWSVWYD